MTLSPAPSAACLPVLKRGDTWSLVFRWLQSSGQPIDLTGCEARMQIRHATSKKLAAVPDSLIIDTPTGSVTATFLVATTETVSPGTYLTDMEVEYVDGTVTSSDTLQIRVAEDITRPAGVGV